MEAVAKLRNIPTSPRKMRLVADMIRGIRVEKALGILKLEPKHNSVFLEKLLLSAISNWENKNEDKSVEEASLVVKTIFVDCGRMLKRLRPAPQGRAHRIRKRSNHVTLVVDSISSETAVVKTKSVKKEEATPKAKATATKSSKTAKKTDK